MTTPQTQPPYKTSELELASFLKSRGHHLIAAKMSGGFVSFEFVSDAAGDADNYFSGAETSARELFEAHRSLRALIKQVREHASQQIGTEKQSNEQQSRRHR
jgi:hypothetical protein